MGVEGVLGGAQGQGEGLGALEVVAGAVVAADGVVVGDAGPVAVQDVTRDGFDLVPDLDLRTGAAA